MFWPAANEPTGLRPGRDPQQRGRERRGRRDQWREPSIEVGDFAVEQRDATFQAAERKLESAGRGASGSLSARQAFTPVANQARG
jgi:hypothetical protein